MAFRSASMHGAAPCRHKLNRPRLKSVLKDEADPSKRLLLLKEDIQDAGEAHQTLHHAGRLDTECA